MRESAFRWSQLAATVALTLSVIVIGMTIASRQQAILDHAVAMKMREKFETNRGLSMEMMSLWKSSGRKPEDDPNYSTYSHGQKVDAYYEQELEKMRLKHPEWFLPLNLRMK